jgi:hypothetical protein
VSGVVWTFVRGNESLRWEVRQREDRYEIVVRQPDRPVRVRRVNTVTELLQEFHVEPLELRKAGWRLPPVAEMWDGVRTTAQPA